VQEDLGMAKSWEQSCRERERFQKSKFSNRLDAVDEKQHRSANLGNGIYSIKIKKKKTTGICTCKTKKTEVIQICCFHHTLNSLFSYAAIGLFPPAGLHTPSYYWRVVYTCRATFRCLLFVGSLSHAGWIMTIFKHPELLEIIHLSEATAKIFV